MAITAFQIKRWFLMLTGKSVEHVCQDVGKYYQKDSIKGYYNNLTEKVTKVPELLCNDELPLLVLEGGKEVVFPVGIFQYGLGAFDLYISTKKELYLEKFLQCADWAIQNQDEKGRWNNFSHIFPKTPYGAMAQGEAASLLIRAYITTGNETYLYSAKKGIDYMLLPMIKGGTTEYINNDVILREFTNQATVLNGWIFAWWGLYDYVLINNNDEYYQDLLNKSLDSIIQYLPKFKNRYWSIYSLDGKITSPFYHNLHIAQMEAMYDLTKKKIFKDYADKWKKQQKNAFCVSIAFIKKAYQKIIEKQIKVI